jgi:hypothetical protein
MAEWPDDEQQRDEVPDEDAQAIQEQIERAAEMSLRRAEAQQQRENELAERRANVRRQRMEPGALWDQLTEPAALTDPEPPQGPQQQGDGNRVMEEIQRILEDMHEMFGRCELHLQKIAESLPSAGAYGP